MRASVEMHTARWDASARAGVHATEVNEVTIELDAHLVLGLDDPVLAFVVDPKLDLLEVERKNHDRAQVVVAALGAAFGAVLVADHAVEGRKALADAIRRCDIARVLILATPRPGLHGAESKSFQLGGWT